MWQLKKNRNRANHKQNKKEHPTLPSGSSAQLQVSAVSHRKNKLDMVHEWMMLALVNDDPAHIFWVLNTDRELTEK